VLDWLSEQVQERDPSSEKPLVVIMDGQISLWNDAEKMFGDRPRVEVLDLLHATSKRREAVHICYPKDRELEVMKFFTWRVLEGETEEVIIWFTHAAETGLFTKGVAGYTQVRQPPRFNCSLFPNFMNDRRPMKIQQLTLLLLASSVALFSDVRADHDPGIAEEVRSNLESVIPPPGGATGNPDAWTFTKITDENIARAVEALPAIVQEAMAKTGVPGIAVAVVRAEEVLLTEGFGVRLVGTAEEVDADTVFQLASLSKPIAATVVSIAVSDSDGGVAWDDPVHKYLPWFRIGNLFVSKNVTIGDLFAHRSGLPDHAGDHLEDLGFKRRQILRRLSLLPLVPFRAEYIYTNFGLTAAAEAVATAYESNWDDLSEDLLYRPARMVSTSSRYADYLSAVNRAVTHQRRSGVWIPGPPRDPDPQSPAGGVSSTANDMARWMQLQLGNGTLEGQPKPLIKRDVIQVMRQPHSISKAATEPLARSTMYGFGLVTSVDGTGHVRWSHSGAFFLGAATNVVMVPGGDIGITVLTNGAPHGIPEAISAQFVDILETGSVQRDWLPLYEHAFDGMYVNPSKLAGKKPPVHPKPPQPLGRYAGTYRNRYYGEARITVVEDRLMMALGTVPYHFQLTHWNGNIFAYYPTGENALGIAAVTFDPKVQTVTVENLDDDGLGTFTIARRNPTQRRGANSGRNSRSLR